MEKENPSVRLFSLTKIKGLSHDHQDVIEAKKAMMNYEPVEELLAIQDPAGWWGNPEHASLPMYTSTAWQLMLLAEMGATIDDFGIRKAVDFVFENAQDEQGAFPHEGSRFQKNSPMDLICNDALISWGLIGVGTSHEDPRMKMSIEFLLDTLSGGDYGCHFNKGFPCAWGVLKSLRVLAAVPKPARNQKFNQVVQNAINFILDIDLAKAAFPSKPGGKVSGHWFKLGFPRSYQADILQTALIMTDFGYAKDRRLLPALEFLEAKKLPDGKWPLQETFNKWLIPFLKKSAHQPSKWVTWQATYVFESAKLA